MKIEEYLTDGFVNLQKPNRKETREGTDESFQRRLELADGYVINLKKENAAPLSAYLLDLSKPTRIFGNDPDLDLL